MNASRKRAKFVRKSPFSSAGRIQQAGLETRDAVDAEANCAHRSAAGSEGCSLLNGDSAPSQREATSTSSEIRAIEPRHACINLPNSVQQARSRARVQSRWIRCRDLACLHKPSAAIVPHKTSRFQRRNGPSRSSECVRNPQKSGAFFSTSQTPKSAAMVRSDVASVSQGCTSHQSPEERKEKGRKQNDQDELKNVRQSTRGPRGKMQLIKAPGLSEAPQPVASCKMNESQ